MKKIYSILIIILCAVIMGSALIYAYNYWQESMGLTQYTAPAAVTSEVTTGETTAAY